MPDDVHSLKEKHDSIINKLTQANEHDFMTKTDLLRELIDVSRPLVKNGHIKGVKQKDLAIYISAKLREYGIKYVRNERYYDLFNPNEKHSEYGTNIKSHNVRAHEHNFVGDEYEKICECGDMIRLGKHYTIAQLDTPEEKLEDVSETNYEINEPREKKEREEIDPYENKTTEALIRQANLCKDMGALLEDQIKKYYKYQDIAEVVEEYFSKKDIEKIIEDAKSAEAKMIHADKQQDLRQKIGEFEKLMAYILEETTYNVAKVAKLINITPKHMTNNVTPEVKEILDSFNWFRVLSVELPEDMKKGDLFAIDIADWFDHMLVRKDLGQEMRPPFLNRKYSAFW